MKEYLFLLRGGKPATDKTEAERKVGNASLGRLHGEPG